MIQNKIVVRYLDGNVAKGYATDFMPNKEVFHLVPVNDEQASRPITVSLGGCKAVFFVKDYAGNPEHEEKKEFDPKRTAVGRKIRVLFKDRETLVGTTQGYQPGRQGFFLFPADPESNMERCYVIADATQEIAFL